MTKKHNEECMKLLRLMGVPVVEAMLALVLADHKLLHRGQCG